MTKEMTMNQFTDTDALSEEDLENVSGGLKIRIPFTDKTIGLFFFTGGYSDAMEGEEADYQLPFYWLGAQAAKWINGDNWET